MTSPIYSIMQLISIHEGYGTDVCIDAARLYCMLFIMFFLYFAELCIWNFLFFKTKVNCKTALGLGFCVFVVFFKIYNKGLVYDFLRYHNIKTLDTVKCIILWKCTLNKDTKYYYKIHYYTCIGVLSEEREVKPTISLKYTVTQANASGFTILPFFSSSATDLREEF